MESKYLRIEELRWLRNLFFASRKPVKGQYAGRHCSPMRGHSVEFSDYRPYMPGDEPTDIDWNAYARSDRLFIKLFEQQSDMTVSLVIDGSASMAYSGSDGGRSKFDHACMMAAAIAFLTTKQQDKVSLTIARDGLAEFCRPSGAYRQFQEMLRTMESFRPSDRADLADALRQTAGMVDRRGVVILFSDLLEDVQATFDSLSIFTHRGGEVIVFHVLHADELKLPSLQEAMFVDSEDAGTIRLNVEDIRRSYDQKLAHFLEVCSSHCKGRGMDYNLVSTSRPHMEALGEYLLRRTSMA